MQKLNEYIENIQSNKNDAVLAKIKEQFAQLEQERNKIKEFKENMPVQLKRKFELPNNNYYQIGIDIKYKECIYEDIFKAIDEKTEDFNNNKASYYMIAGCFYQLILYDKMSCLQYYQSSMHEGNSKALLVILKIMIENKLNVFEYILLDENKKYRNEMIEWFKQRHGAIMRDCLIPFLDSSKV